MEHIDFLRREGDGIAASSITPLRFPAGEWHLKNIDPAEESAVAVVRDATGDALILLGLWADAMRSLGQRTVAYIPYAPAARADRGTPFGARVYASIINSFELDEVVIFDPHSPVIVEEINNVRVIPSAPLVAEFLKGHAEPFAGIIAPDAGAVERAGAVAERLGLPLYRASKKRDFESGVLSGFEVEELPEEGKLLVIDDCCNGGGTFAGLALASGLPPERLALWISHRAFSGKARGNLAAFGEIITTDSLPETDVKVPSTVLRIIPWLLEEKVLIEH